MNYNGSVHIKFHEKRALAEMMPETIELHVLGHKVAVIQSGSGMIRKDSMFGFQVELDKQGIVELEKKFNVHNHTR